jgi:predicted PhzF superfamily epimerase YddE/YHI9
MALVYCTFLVQRDTSLGTSNQAGCISIGNERLPTARQHRGRLEKVLPRGPSSNWTENRVLANGFATINLVHAKEPRLFHARNPFAAGGVYEDPATGAAAAALAGYLRDIAWAHGDAIEIIQGEDMGVPSRLHVAITPQRGASIRISGTMRVLA